MKNSRNLLNILLITLFPIINSVVGQASLSGYGVKKYGVSFEEPFHSVTKVRHDSIGNLYGDLYDQTRELYFNGKQFETVEKSIPYRILLKEEKGHVWYLTDPFTLVYQEGKSMQTLNIKNFLTRNIIRLIKAGGNYYCITNDGYLQVKKTNERLEVEFFKNCNSTVIKDVWHHLDTVFIDIKNRPCWFETKNPEKLNEIAIEGRNTKYFLLPKDRIVIDGHDSRVLAATSPYYPTLMNSGNTIKKRFLDSQNRLWYVVRSPKEQGLYVVDSFLNKYKVDLGISDNTYINHLFEDRFGDMWVSTDGQGVIHVFRSSIQTWNKAFGTKVDNIWSISEGIDQNVYLATGCSGVDIVTPDKKVQHRFESNCQSIVYADRSNRLWHTNDILSMLNLKTGEERNYSKEDGIYSSSITVIHEDNNDDIWVGTRRAIHKLEDNKFRQYIIEDSDTYDKVIDIVEEDDGSFLIAMNSGEIYRFSSGNFTLVSVHTNVLRLYRDLWNNDWLSVEGEGLSLYRNGQTTKVNHTLIPEQISFLQCSRDGRLFGLCANNSIFYFPIADAIKNPKSFDVKVMTEQDGLPLINSNEDVSPNCQLLTDGRIAFPNIHGAIVIDPQKLDGQKKNFPIVVRDQDRTLAANNEYRLSTGDDDLLLHLQELYLNPNSTILFQYRINGSSWLDVQDPNNLMLSNLDPGKNELKVRAKHVNQEWMEPNSYNIYVPRTLIQKAWFRALLLLSLAVIIYAFVQWRTKLIKRRNEELQAKVREQTTELIKEKSSLAESLKMQTKLAAELNLSQQTKNRMYAQISHEFKSPLQSIKSYLRTADKGLLPSDKTRISANIDKLLNISNEVLELSKAESGNLKAKKHYYNINSILQEQIELFHSLIIAKDLTVQTDGLSRRIYLLIDLNLMQKVVSNLLSNAIKFAKESSTLSIRSHEYEDHLVVAIKDQGVGIPKEDLQNLTQPYFQASNNRIGGTGIGLSLVQKILNLHDAQLKIDSTLNEGSTFSFSLTLPEESQSSLIKKYGHNLGLREQFDSIINPDLPEILVVDDNEDVLLFIHNALKNFYNVIKAANGHEALNAIDHRLPQAIISDVNMPLMGGLELLKTVHSDPATKHIPFVFLTGSASEETSILSLKSGAHLVLQKPINEEKLQFQLSQILQREKSLEEKVKTSFAHGLLPPNLQDVDLNLMQKIEEVLNRQLSNNKLKSADIANALGIGEKTLRNKVKSITGYTIKEYLKRFRLEKAKLLLEEDYGTKSEIALAVGFSSLSYFSKSLKNYEEMNVNK